MKRCIVKSAPRNDIAPLLTAFPMTRFEGFLLLPAVDEGAGFTVVEEFDLEIAATAVGLAVLNVFLGADVAAGVDSGATAVIVAVVVAADAVAVFAAVVTDVANEGLKSSRFERRLGVRLFMRLPKNVGRIFFFGR